VEKKEGDRAASIIQADLVFDLERKKGVPFHPQPPVYVEKEGRNADLFPQHR